MSSEVKCDQCGHEYEFLDGQVGIAWIEVAVFDGDIWLDGQSVAKSPLMTRQFCSPECSLMYLRDPVSMGTVTFPSSYQRKANEVAKAAAVAKPRRTFRG